MFVSIEGCEASGKSTQASILAEYYINLGYQVYLTKEPGGTVLAEKIREIFLSNEIMDPLTEFILLTAARRDHILYIQKLLEQNYIVISDRFSDSSYAYQGYAKGLDLNKIHAINSIANDNFQPHITILLDISIDEMQKRLQNSITHNSFYDVKNQEFHKKVKEGFLTIAAENQNRIHIINADVPLYEVTEEIMKILSRYIPKL